MTKQATKRLQALIRSRSRTILIVFALLTACAAAAATGVKIDASVEHLMMSDDPARALDALAKEEFGNDEVILIAFDLGAPYDAADLRKLANIADEIESIPGIDNTKSLANTEDIRGTEDTLDASPLVSFESLETDLPTIRARTRDHRLYERSLVSDEQDVFGMYVYSENTGANTKEMNALTARVMDRAREIASPWNAYYAGYPVTAYEANRIVKGELALLTPVTLLAICLVLVWFTRRAFPIVLLVALCVWVETVAIAWLSISGTPINVIVSSLPTILLATSSTYVIYTVGLLSRVADDDDPGVALVPLLFRPVLLSGLSTGIGFFSLSLINVEAIGELGLGMSVGILAATAGTLLLLPAIVHLTSVRFDARRISALEHLALHGVRLARRPWIAVGVTALLVAVAIPGVMKLRVHTDTIEYFAEGSLIKQGARFFEEHLASGFLINFVVRGHEPDRVLDSEVLAFADEIADHVEASPTVDRTVSMLDYFYMMDAALVTDRLPRTNPGSREAAAQYMLLYESSGSPEDYDRYINFERSALSVLASVQGGSSAYIELADSLDSILEGAPMGVTVETLGTTFLYSRAMDGLTRGMLLGLAVATLLIGGVMWVGLRSITLAAIAAIPNLTPLLLCGGAIGWFDIPLSMGTSLVGCIALGLAVDDTAHVLGHIDEDESLEDVYRVVGPALILTTIALGLGFSSLTLSEFQSVTALGIATAITLVVALIADLLLLPSLLVFAGYRTVRSEDDAAASPLLVKVNGGRGRQRPAA
jgi:predicted RND superfamily exporter protein